ncbi:hypothetical protein ACSBLW_03115 [Thioclava sp. FR2]|uniref:hypothetical protein n=1 Tax=Thioclava sp. FR2 TaxID=3445780 RepID=UPI003EBC2B9B
MLRFFPLFLCLTALPAVACPYRLEPGQVAVLTSENPPSTERFTRTDKGVTQHRLTQWPEGPDEANYLYPHPLIVGERVSDGVTLSFRYKGNPLEWLDQLPSRQGWRANVVLYRDGVAQTKGTNKLEFLGLGRVEIGDCRYGVWRVQEVMELDGMEPITFEKAFNPDLGLVLLVTRTGPDGSALSVAGYDRIEVED